MFVYKNFLKFAWVCGYFIVLIVSANPSMVQASVIIHGTRIIYPSDKREVIVRAENISEAPSLVQAWIDDGGENSLNVNKSSSPFLLSPPLVRIEGKSGQVYKILKLPSAVEALKKDVESLYYFNLMEIPKNSKENKDANFVQVSFTNKLKLFYRPENLKGTLGQAVEELVWQLQENDGKIYLEIDNQSAYYVTFANGKINIKNEKKEYLFNYPMISPKTKILVPFEGDGLKISEGNYLVNFGWINDAGLVVSHERAINN